MTHVGNTDVSAASWRRNDFPFWKYFDKNASADSSDEMVKANRECREKEAARRKLYYEHSIEEAAQIKAYYADSVVKTWRETEAELGAYGVEPDGKMSHISQMMVQRAIKWMNGDDSGDILGSTVGSALKAAMDALYSLEHPLEPNHKHSPKVEQARKKEKEFYELFTQKLI